MKTIYSDNERAITVNGCMLTINKSDNSKIDVMIDNDLSASTDIPANFIAAFKAKGLNPADFYVLLAGSIVRAALPLVTREAVETAIREYCAEVEAARRDPVNMERTRIDRLYAQAQRACDNGNNSEYFSLKAQADKALAAWREAYPAAANNERKHALEADADALEAKAKGALLYDADGDLSREQQQARHDSWMAAAQAKRDEAAKL
ncbi:MAG: hypothetical protein WBL79_00030 [Bacillota bacterium]